MRTTFILAVCAYLRAGFINDATESIANVCAMHTQLIA
jgi:hypothetical protein